ncbi:MAG: hypothetical protein KAT34_08225 [Candidatus Aminicenantes bacterium]|nr:hypothetical protein [Candidatus Aminicenantes bacterium]
MVEDGDSVKLKGTNVLSVSLLFPAPGKQEITKIVPGLDLRRNTLYDFKNAKNPRTGKKYVEFERILFKEEIHSECWILIYLSDVVKRNAVDKFMGKLIKGLYKTTLGVFTGNISNLLLKIPDDIIIAEIDDIETDPDDIILMVGKAYGKVKIDYLPDDGSTKTIDFGFKVPKNIYRSKRIPDFKNMRWIKETEKNPVLAAGADNGKLSLNFRSLS